MIKSLYGKFVFFTIGTMLASFILAFLAVNTYYHQHLKVQNDEKNIEIAKNMVSYIELDQTIDLDAFLQTEADAGYKLFIASGDDSSGQFFGEPFRLDNLSDQAIRDVLDGNDYHGMRDLPKETFVTGFFSDELANSVGVPFTYQGKNYALFLRPNIKLLFSEIHYLLAGLFVVMAVVSIAFMLYVARKIVKPISQLTSATKQIGMEQFSLEGLPQGRKDEIGQLATSFQTMTKQLQESDRSRKQFINDVSHDFQTPLQNIHGYASLIEEQVTTEEERKKYGSIIQEETARLSGLTKQLLLLTSLDSLDVQLEKEPTRIDIQIRKTLESYRWRVTEKEIALSAELDEVTVFGHAAFLEKIWENLLSNAIKYTEVGGDIDVVLVGEGDWMTATFADKGIGIAAENIPRLFERFYRVDAARHMEVGGTGLGLSIAEQVVRLHGGEIVVDSWLGQGTTFKVRLPVG